MEGTTGSGISRLSAADKRKQSVVKVATATGLRCTKAAAGGVC